MIGASESQVVYRRVREQQDYLCNVKDLVAQELPDKPPVFK